MAGYARLWSLLGLAAVASTALGQKDWWETAGFYQIYPRSFQDSDGDGIGDLNGITSRLSYLKSLGITAFWLSPIYKSPMADFGYDISDFRDIHEDYGTMIDFEGLLAKAHEIGLKVILDFVPNHSSDEHEWFVKSENREAGYEDYYVWHDGVEGTPPNNWVEAFRGSAWQWSSKRQQYYLHQFHKKQVDLNYHNPVVVQEMKNVLKFWLDKGVDGFRIDAVPWLFEAAGFPDEPVSGSTTDPLNPNYLNHIYTLDQPETLDMVYQWREVMDQYKKDHNTDTKVMMTEAWSSLDIVHQYFNDSNFRQGANMPFNFQLILRLDKNSKASDFKTVIDSWLATVPPGHTPNWVLGNHDKRRVGSRMGGDHMVDIMAMIELTLPGVTVTYQGEEIGMLDVDISYADSVDPAACQASPQDYQDYSRDPERTPFQWDDSANAGFTSASKPWLPVSPAYQTLNVVAQEAASNSHLKVFRELMKLRGTNTLVWGSYDTQVLGTNVLAILRAYDNDNKFYVTLTNIGSAVETVDATSLSSKLPSTLQYRILGVSSTHAIDETVSTNSIQLQPYEALVLTNNVSRIFRNGTALLVSILSVLNVIKKFL